GGGSLAPARALLGPLDGRDPPPQRALIRPQGAGCASDAPCLLYCRPDLVVGVGASQRRSPERKAAVSRPPRSQSRLRIHPAAGRLPRRTACSDSAPAGAPVGSPARAHSAAAGSPCFRLRCLPSLPPSPPCGPSCPTTF